MLLIPQTNHDHNWVNISLVSQTMTEPTYFERWQTDNCWLYSAAQTKVNAKITRFIKMSTANYFSPETYSDGFPDLVLVEMLKELDPSIVGVGKKMLTSDWAKHISRHTFMYNNNILKNPPLLLPQLLLLLLLLLLLPPPQTLLLIINIDSWFFLTPSQPWPLYQGDMVGNCFFNAQSTISVKSGRKEGEEIRER